MRKHDTKARARYARHHRHWEAPRRAYRELEAFLSGERIPREEEPNRVPPTVHNAFPVWTLREVTGEKQRIYPERRPLPAGLGWAGRIVDRRNREIRRLIDR